MNKRGTYPVFHPPFSLDRNRAKVACNKMKDYIAKHYPEKMAYDQLREAVKAVGVVSEGRVARTSPRNGKANQKAGISDNPS